VNSILPNQRWLTLPSKSLGEDWWDKCLEIDEVLPRYGLDLADESVYFLYDRSPGPVLNREGECLVARSVIGPKKEWEKPFKLIDWVSAPVYRKVLRSETWDQILEEAYLEWENLQQMNIKVSRSFILCLKRQIEGALKLHIEVIFSE
jgi:hypothetical protein